MNNPDYHKLLQRQIRKYLEPDKQYPPEVLAFISAVDDSYKHYETDRELIERAMTISSEELESLLADVREKSDLQKKILNQLKTLLDNPDNRSFHQNDDDLELLVRQLQKELDEKNIAHRALRENEQNLKALIENTDGIILSIDTEYKIITFNSHFAEVLRILYPESKLRPEKGVSVSSLISEELLQQLRTHFEDAFKTNSYQKEVKYPIGGALRHLEISFNSIIQESTIIGTTVFIRDVTERAEQKEIIEKALQEKEVLLKEIHHRVKNNLQVIMSLLNLQSKRIPDLTTRTIFKTSQHRINSIAVVHEMLYHSKDLSKINFEEYIENLVVTLIKSFKGEDHQITLQLDIEKTHLVMDLAIPLGLIINEIVTNSLKYGIDREGLLSITLRKENEVFELHLCDDGPGLNDQLPGNSKKLGLQMVDYLTQQIEGTYDVISESKGAHIKLTFTNQETYT